MNEVRSSGQCFIYLTLFCMFFVFACGQSAKVSKEAGGEFKEVQEASTELKAALAKLQPSGFVNDFGGYLDEDAKPELEITLRDLKTNADIDMAIVVVRTTEGHSIDDFALQLARDWKIGSANGGILLMIAVEDRAWRIQIDRRLERDLTNEEVKQMGEKMIPELRENNYAGALKTCTKEIISALAQKQGFQHSEQ